MERGGNVTGGVFELLIRFACSRRERRQGEIVSSRCKYISHPQKKQLVGSLELLIESGCIIWTSNKDSELERQKTLELQYVYSQMKRKMTARDESDAAFQSPPIFGDFPLSPLFCPFFQ